MNKTGNYRFTVIVPVYDEEENINRLESELADYLANAPVRTCVVFVNDGSKDQSPTLLKDVCTRNHDMFYIELEKNSGLSTAIKAGIDNTFSPYVGYMDADLQTTPQDFNLLLAEIQYYAMVTGVREERRDGFVKRTSSKFANGFRRMITHDGIADTGCPLKVIRTDYAKRIPFFKGMHRFLPALIQLQDGGTVKQITVRHFPRIAGKSKYNTWNRLAGPLKDCFAYRWMRKRYINYSIAESNLT